MTALEIILQKEAASQMHYAARTLGLNNRDATEIGMRRVECGPGGSAVSPVEFIETIGLGKTENFAKDGLKHSRPVVNDDGEEVEVLSQEITIRNPDTLARFGQAIGQAYGFQSDLLDAAVDTADQQDADNAEAQRLLEASKAQQAELASQDAETGEITSEMIAEASKADLVSFLRARGVSVDARAKETAVRELAEKELTNV
jgi:hypothetical protein